jgi:hypothetical protein
MELIMIDMLVEIVLVENGQQHYLILDQLDLRQNQQNLPQHHKLPLNPHKNTQLLKVSIIQVQLEKLMEVIPKQTKSTDISSLESYPSYSPESGESMKVAIQPVIIKVPTPSGRNNSTDFPVAIGVNNSMSNTSKLYA